MATTVEAIRDNMITLVEALSPGSRARSKFKVNRSVEEDFTEWAEEHSSSCLRRFAIRDTGGYELPEVSDHQEERIRANLEVLVAYPRKMPSIAGGDGKRDLYDMIRQDMHQIDTAIGHRGQASYLGGQGGTYSLTKEILEGESVVFCALEVETYFHRDMT